MDYKTKPTSRKDLRRYSKFFRDIYGVPHTGIFPVLQALDKLSDIFEGCNYEIVEDSKLPSKTMARCIPNDQGGLTVEIKEIIYKGAYEKKIGAYLGFICHELCHIFLFSIGFTPIFERSFDDKAIPAYCSVEWQAKALCAEVMIPYEESVGMGVTQIMDNYQVSKAFAQHRVKLGRRR